MNVLVTLGVYLLLVNVIGFSLMGIDKWKAKRGAFRVPENTLFIIALIGGSLGSIIGMYTFRHKTRHWYFVYGMPAIFLIEAALLAWLYFSFHITIM